MKTPKFSMLLLYEHPELYGTEAWAKLAAKEAGIEDVKIVEDKKDED